MVEFDFKVDTSGGEREIRLIADALSPERIDEVLRLYGERWLARRVAQHFEERPGWPPPKEVTQARIVGGAEKRAVGKLKTKLTKELRRARKRLGILETSGGFSKEEERQRFLASQGRRHRSMTEVIQSRKSAVARREMVIAQLDELVGGSKLEGRAGTKLTERFGRAVEREKSRKPLGRIAQSFKLTVEDGRLTYGSEVKWAGVHNDGGSAGHGANIPQRKFAYLEPEDVEVLVAMLLGEGIDAEVR